MNFKKIMSLILIVFAFSAINFADGSNIDRYYDDKLDLFGLEDKDGNIILKPLYSSMSEFRDGYAVVFKDNKAGIINKSGKLLIDTMYDELSYVKDGHALAVKEDKIGLISINNKVVIDFIWDGVYMVEYPSDYSTFVYKKDKIYGVANYKGEILLNDIESKLSHISDSSVVFSNGDYVGVMDFKKNIIIDEIYLSIYQHENGYIAEGDDGYIFLDLKGNTLSKEAYKSADLIKDSLYVVSRDGEKHGIYDAKKEKLIIPLEYLYIDIRENYHDNDKEYIELSTVDSENIYASKKGIADFDGNILIEANYKNLEFVSKDLISYTDADYNEALYSLISNKSTGTIFSDYTYDLDTELIIVTTDDYKHGLLDKNLNKVLPIDSDSLFKTSNVYISKKDEKYAIYNPLIKKLGDYKYDSINYFENHNDRLLSKVKFNDKYGMITENERFFIDPIYEELGDFKNGRAIISKNDLYGFIDEDGNEFIEAKYEKLSNYINGLASFKLNGKYGFLDKSGNIAIEAKYDKVSSFDDDGYAAVSIADKVGVINKLGNYTIEPIYSDISKLKGDLIEIQDYETGLYGLADINGKVLIDTNCEKIGYFGNYDVTHIKVNSQYALINVEGEIISSFDFDYIGSFNYSFADIEIGDKKGYINTRGEYILE